MEGKCRNDETDAAALIWPAIDFLKLLHTANRLEVKVRPKKGDGSMRITITLKQGVLRITITVKKSPQP